MICIAATCQCASKQHSISKSDTTIREHEGNSDNSILTLGRKLRQ